MTLLMDDHETVFCTLPPPLLGIEGVQTVHRIENPPYGATYTVKTDWGTLMQSFDTIIDGGYPEVITSALQQAVQDLRASFEKLTAAAQQMAASAPDLLEGIRRGSVFDEVQEVDPTLTVIDEDEAVALIRQAAQERGRNFVDQSRRFDQGCIVGWAVGGLLGRRGSWAPNRAPLGLFNGHTGDYLRREGDYYFTEKAEKVLHAAMHRNDAGWTWGQIAAEAQNYASDLPTTMAPF